MSQTAQEQRNGLRTLAGRALLPSTTPTKNTQPSLFLRQNRSGTGAHTAASGLGFGTDTSPTQGLQTSESIPDKRKGKRQTARKKEGKKKKKQGYASLPTQPKQSEGGERGGVKSQIRPLWLGPAPQMRPLPLPSGGSSYIWSCLTAAGLPAAFWAKSKPFPVHQRPSIT